MRIADEIHKKLNDAFQPELLEVVDDSESHRGHAGFQDGGESHFNVMLKVPALASQSRVARHRAVHAAIGKDILARIHALALDIRV
ncbi:BolA family protein [Cochlodiniinecator piscidefendens]|uniref:BolA family protein n=1 Tax=Cochlodiniinecator piscidefendens TaxID=2715756 RepID=UPI00140CC9FD|nr:BolA family protein [Cochlodiniinecator piscidefendens]